MKKNWSPPKLSMDSANTIRAKYLEGASINLLAKRYAMSRVGIKSILKGKTYNKFGDYEDLMLKRPTGLF
jgi:Mor family transcriptional regulator